MRIARPVAGVMVLLAALALTGAARAEDAPAKPAAPPATRELNTINDIFAALRACWIPPPADQAQEGMQITVRFSFTREGAILGEPRFTFLTRGVRETVRAAYERAVVDALNRCTPLPFSPSLGRALAGQPFSMRFIDNRSLPGAHI